MSIGTMSRRGVGLVVALLLAAFATAAWVSYVRGIENKAVRGNDVIQVLVAKDTIPAGTSGEFAVSKGLVERTGVPRRLVVDGAVTDQETLRGRVAGATVVKGEQITSARFVSPEVAGRLLTIPEGKHAMAVQVEAPPGVGGFVQPRDHVSIIANVARTSGEGNEVRFLMQDIEVLAVGLRTTTQPPASSGAREASRKETEAEAVQDTMILTLAVSPFQAEQLAYAILEGNVYFTLLPPGSKPLTTPGRNGGNLFG